MLKWEDAKRIASDHRLAAFAIAGSALATGIVLISPVFQECVKGNQYGNSGEPFYEGTWVFIRSLWWCGGVFAKENGEAITGLATVIMAIFTGTLWSASTRQGDVAQQSIDLARDEFTADHRPWVSVKIGFGPDGVTFPEDGSAQLQLVFVCKNSGTSPALQVCEAVEVAFDRPTDRMARLREVCESQRYRGSGGGALGAAIFPGEEIPLSVSTYSVGKEWRDTLPNNPSGDFVMPVIIGAIAYRFPFGEGKWHFTRFIYDVGAIGPNGMRLAIRISSGDKPGPQLTMSRWIQSDAFDAD